MPERWSQRHHEELKTLLEHTHFLQHRILERIDTVMTTAAELKAGLAEALAAVTENTSLIGSIGATMTALETAVTALEEQVAALVADNANDVGSEDVAEINESIGTIKGALADQKARIAEITTNTPDEPPVEPAA